MRPDGGDLRSPDELRGTLAVGRIRLWDFPKVGWWANGGGKNRHFPLGGIANAGFRAGKVAERRDEFLAVERFGDDAGEAEFLMVFEDGVIDIA